VASLRDSQIAWGGTSAPGRSWRGTEGRGARRYNVEGTGPPTYFQRNKSGGANGKAAEIFLARGCKHLDGIARLRVLDTFLGDRVARPPLRPTKAEGRAPTVVVMPIVFADEGVRGRQIEAFRTLAAYRRAAAGPTCRARASDAGNSI